MPSFKPELLEKILSGDKTQTRRPVKDGEKLITLDGLKTVLTPSGRIKFQVGRTYACTYGRAKPTARWGFSEAGDNKLLVTWEEYQNWNQHTRFDEQYHPMRYELLDIREEHVGNICEDDAIDEGFYNRNQFHKYYLELYEKKALQVYNTLTRHHRIKFMKNRTAWYYHAFAYTFKLLVNHHAR